MAPLQRPTRLGTGQISGVVTTEPGQWPGPGSSPAGSRQPPQPDAEKEVADGGQLLALEEVEVVGPAVDDGAGTTGLDGDPPATGLAVVDRQSG